MVLEWVGAHLREAQFSKASLPGIACVLHPLVLICAAGSPFRAPLCRLEISIHFKQVSHGYNQSLDYIDTRTLPLQLEQHDGRLESRQTHPA